MKANFQAVVDGIAAMTCVVSVEKLEDGSCGELRIVTGNRAYIDSIENPAPGTQMLTQKFTPNTPYTDYLTRDLNFESYCYGAAVQKKCLHSYAHPERMNVWFNMTFLPLDADEGNLSYCTYTMEINFAPDSDRLSNVSGDLASKVLGMAVALRSTDDFEDSMMTIARDVRSLCKAEYCCILRVDEIERRCSVLAESIAEGSSLLPMDAYLDENFYAIVESWESTISGSNCIIAKDARDMDVVKERNPIWHESLRSASIESIVLFPLKSHGALLGYIWAVNFDPDDSTTIKEALELTTYVLAAEIDNHLMLDRLKELSSKDALTGLNNRHEMDVRIEQLARGSNGPTTSVGVIFADLNGLKTVNDEDGHAAGDKLLIDGASALSDTFAPETIFRAGGDEFVVIETGITQQQLADKIAALKGAAEQHGAVSFAIGSCIEADARNVRRALRTADARMYEDKDAHYGRRGSAIHA